jgi:type II secretory pathway component PulM
MSALDSLRSKWDSITPRERRMVALLGISAVVVAVLYIAPGIRDGMVKLEKKNERSRLALQTITTLKARPVTAAAGGGAPDIPTEPVKLESYLYTAASKAGITLNGVNTRGNATRGAYTVHGATVELRDLTLQQATDFLEAIENDSKVVLVTGLQVRRNFRDKEKIELSVEVSTYSKAAAAPAEPGKGSGKGSGSGSGKTGGAS